MGYSKRQFIREALSEIGIADYEYDVSAEQREAVLRRLDTMMGSWLGKGIDLGYPLPDDPEFSDDTIDTEVQTYANEAIITNLAIRISPSYGKEPSARTLITAKDSLNVLYLKFGQPTERQLPQMPVGAGYKQYDWPFSEDPEVS